MNLPTNPLPVSSPIQFWTALGIDQPHLIEIDGRESISRPYSFTLKMRGDAITPLDITRLAGTNAHIRIRLPESSPLSGVTPSREVRDFCGILSQISCDGVDDNFTYYTATLKPRLWSLGLNRKYRFFTQKTTKEIVTAVLPQDMPVVWRLSSEIDASDSCFRNYCVQYAESDATFIGRLLEEDGLFYYFEHQYDGQADDPAQHAERLVITDHIASIPESEVPIIQFDSDRGGNREATRITQWREVIKIVPDAIDSLDRTFQRPSRLVQSLQNYRPDDESPEPTSPPQDESDPEAMKGDHDAAMDSDASVANLVTLYPSGSARRYDAVTPGGGSKASELDQMDAAAQRDAKIRSQRLALRRSIAHGSGNVPSLMPGTVFRLLRGLVPDASTHYITSVQHRIRLATNVRSGLGTPKVVYRNRFRCHATTLPYRSPHRSPRPSIPGVVPATVVSDLDQSDDQICIDQYGRVKVAFPWQKDNTDPSCWIRVSQFWAGPRWGAFFWPRVGHEVLVAFEHGDPDRPVIVGSVYNAENMPPLTLPEHKLSCGINSCTHNGDPLNNASCVIFHDKEGAEYLQLHSETYLAMSSETKNLKWSSGEEIVFQGHHWLFDAFDGSGSGGSDFTGQSGPCDNNFKKRDEGGGVSAADVLLDFFLANNKGAIEFVVGDSYKKTFGRTFETYYGCNIWLGCDPVQFFEYLADKTKVPGIATAIPLLFGAGGQGKTLFGGSQDIQYGTKVDCHRGHSITKTSRKPGTTTFETTEGNEGPVDIPSGRFCEIAVALLLLIDFVVMLLTKAAVANNGKRWETMIRICEVWSLMILPRLQGLLERVESTTGTVDILSMKVKRAVKDTVTDAEQAARAATVPGEGAAASEEVVTRARSNAVDNGRGAASDAVEMAAGA